MKTSGVFPAGTIFKSFDALIQPDFIFSTWVCFLEYHFSLGLTYPFPGIVFKFFKVTKISYIQVIPVIRKTIFCIDRLNHAIDLDIGLSELAHTYDLLSFRSSLFLFIVKTNKSHIILRSKQNDGAWKEKYFLVRQDSILVEISYEKPALKMVDVYFIMLRILKFMLPFFNEAFKFEEVVPSAEDTEQKILVFPRLNVPSNLTILASKMVLPPLL